jgi:pre-mRNA-splicing factor ATP-dependent RNA helicase DHX15/PRP43
LANRVAEEMGSKNGEVVGYKVRFDEMLSQTSKIKYITDGMLIREAIADPTLKRYSVIILDEAHERTINSDVLIALVKKIATQRQNKLHIVVMSATLELGKFQKYFSDIQPINDGCVINIEGRTFPIEIYHTLESQEDYITCVVKTVLQVLLFENNGDILVFLTGQEEIEEIK